MAAAADMRSKQYPALPPARERRLRLVLPRAGDLRFRSLLPDAFRRRLLVHSEDARRGWYARFSLERRFIVMSCDGDLYTNTARVALAAKDLRLLAMPAVTPGDLLRALDLAACRALPAGRPQWEIVLVRWRNGGETWLPLDAVHATHPHLLQALYVNTINSWALRDRVLRASLAAHQTEVELWLYHKEFQAFYQQLRRRRALQAQPQYQQQQQQQQTASGSATVDVKPVMSGSSTDAQQASNSYRMPPPAQATAQNRPMHAAAGFGAIGSGASPSTHLAASRTPPFATSELYSAQQQRQAALEANRLLYLQQQQQRYLQQQQQYLQRQGQHQQYRQSLQPAGGQQRYQLHTPLTPQPLPIRPAPLQHISPAPSAPVTTIAPRPAQVPQHPPPVAEENHTSTAQHQPPVRVNGPQLNSQPQPEPSPEAVAARLASHQNLLAQPASATPRTGLIVSGPPEDEPSRSSSTTASSPQAQDRSRVRKRLARSHVDDDEDDDDLPDLTRRPRPPSSSSKSTETVQITSKNREAADKPIDHGSHSSHIHRQSSDRAAEARKSRKRLRQNHANSPSGGSDVDMSVLEIGTNGRASGARHEHHADHHHKSIPSISKIHRSPRATPSFDDGQSIDASWMLAFRDAEKLGKDWPDNIAAAEIVESLMRDIDVFGLCLAEKTVRGWTVAHFAAAAGRHDLIVQLGNRGDVDLDAADLEGLTPLHIAAMKDHTACVRRLLEFGVDIMAKDQNGVIPMLYAASVACMREFMHYKLTKHLSRLHRMLPRRQHQGLVRQWQRQVVLDPTCFDMLNDWCSCDLGRIERMDGIFLSNRWMLRLDNKIEFIREYMTPCLVQAEDDKCPTKKLRFTFTSAANASFWRQFVDAATRLEPSDFRSRFTFAMVSSRGTTLTYEGKGIKLVLIRLAADLLRQDHGVLLRGKHDDTAIAPGAAIRSLVKASEDELRARLVDLYVLGEFMAHLALFSIPTSSIFNFSPWFLDGVFSDDAANDGSRQEESCWATLGRSFRHGFQAVLPSVLSLLHPAEFRVLQNSASEITLNACAIDWSSAVEWVFEASKDGAPTAKDAAPTDMNAEPEQLGDVGEENSSASWFSRLSTELVAEEQQLLLLFMTQTLPAASALFFLPLNSEDNGRNNARTRVRIVVGAEEQGSAAGDRAEKEGRKQPFMCHKTRTLHLPRYPDYDGFKTSILRAVRRLDRAFMAVYD